MDIVKTISETRQLVSNARKAGKIIGFVPTMGALHVGHASLIDVAAAKCDFVVVSIFVNPTQFGPSEDLDKYPRTLDEDAKLCAEHGANLIFAPEVSEMYPDKIVSWIDVEQITDSLCGQFRPDHFRGVTTVCAKLFNIVLADYAFFGQKDAQQVAVIKRMVTDLNMPLEIIACPTIRDKDGRATSSRNKYLSESQRNDALLISKALFKCADSVKQGTYDTNELIAQMADILAKSPNIELQYIEIVDTENLRKIDKITDKALVAIAAFAGKTRLIDNILLDLNNL